nr:hypothetical protein [Tanacetum cinerariifolium]
MKGFATNDQAYYYSGITSITVNGKNAYELKGKFLDDFHSNAFSGISGEDAIEHIEYFLKIIDPIDLPNVNQDKLRVVIFPISLDYRKLGSDEVEPTNENTFNLEETKQDDEQEIEWPTYNWREDGYCNRGNLPGAYIVGNTLRYQDLKWYDALKDSNLKEEALRNKAIMEGLINEDVESNNEGWKNLDDFKNTNGDRNEWEYESEHEDDERYELCDKETHELPVCNIRRFEMIKYSFGQDEEYVAVKEYEYEDLTSTSEDTCRAYQEIFRIMDEGCMVTRME